MNERCFALGQKYDRCAVLCLEKCAGYDQCPFYKPRWLFDKSQQLANVRLRSLPNVQQTYIGEKYHGGQMPWKREASK